MNEWVWSNGGMILTGETEVTGEGLPLCYLFHRMEWLGFSHSFRDERPATNRPPPHLVSPKLRKDRRPASGTCVQTVCDQKVRFAGNCSPQWLRLLLLCARCSVHRYAHTTEVLGTRFEPRGLGVFTTPVNRKYISFLRRGLVPASSVSCLTIESWRTRGRGCHSRPQYQWRLMMRCAHCEALFT
jgi:hypothetical protein